MRDYAKVSPKFWIGKTGKALRKQGMEAVIVGMYLMSAPSSNMLGLYYVSMATIAHETGLGLEGASKGLQSAIEAGFCAYDDDAEVVWVYEMAAYQIAERLESRDNRCAGVQRDYNDLPENQYLRGFYDRYASAFHMKSMRDLGSPSEAPIKPLQSQEQEQEQKQKQEQASVAPSAPPDARATAADLSIAMRKAGVQTQPADPRLIALAAQGVQPETATAACAVAVEAQGVGKAKPGYVFAILERWAAEALTLQVAGAAPPPARAAPPGRPSRHVGFDKLDYSEGIENGRIT
jgi:hypothetical protein